MEVNFSPVMSGRSKEQLLAVLREGYDYVPEAVSAAEDELKRRGVNRFDIAAASDCAEDNELSVRFNERVPMSSKEALIWLFLPILAITPIGPKQFRRFANLGYRRKSIQLLENSCIGFMLYAIVLALILPYF